jgi:3-deoxy-manno-octulosonate cytidylyltransferase (CMP-KDO synthetase)
MTQPLILIPARFASTRFPGKPLQVLRGPDGPKTLLRRTWEVAQQLDGVTVRVATDDDRIAAEGMSWGGEVVMTSPECRNGTERCAEAVARMAKAGEEVPEVVVNLQGDAPLTPDWFLTALIGAMTTDPAISVATPVLRCDRETWEHFTADRRAGAVGGTTAVFDRQGRALYFSKEVLPFTGPLAEGAEIPVFHHVGVYAYRPAALKAYASWGEARLERHEGLEQLRFLENGTPVTCVEVEGRGRVFWELNNPHDIARIETILNGESA